MDAQYQADQTEELEKLRTKKESLAELKPVWNDKSKLETAEIPNLKQRKIDFEEKLGTLRLALEDLNDTLGVFTGDFAAVQDLMKDAAIHDQNRNEMKKADEEIKKVEGERNPAAKGTQPIT